MADFDQSVAITLEHEGGFNQNPKTGEVVNFGITQAFLMAHHLPASVDDLKQLRRVGAITLYRLFFWVPMRLTEIKDQTLAAKVFDLGVNQGPETSAALLQGAINDEWGRECLTVDGEIGDITIGCANTGDAVKILSALRARAKAHYERLAEDDPNKYAGDLKGWLIRLAS